MIELNPTLCTTVEGRDDEGEFHPHALLDCGVEKGPSQIIPSTLKWRGGSMKVSCVLKPSYTLV